MKALLDIEDFTLDLESKRRASEALASLGSSHLLDLEALSRVIRKFVETLDPARAKGHALERVETAEGREPRFACIMPGCEICGVSNAAREILDQIVES